MKRAVAQRDQRILDRAVGMFEQAFDAVDKVAGLDRAIGVLNFAGALLDQYDASGLTASLEQAVSLLEGHKDQFPQGHPQRLMYLQHLGRAYLRHAQFTGHTVTLDKAVRAREQALTLARRRHPQHGDCLTDLGVALIHRNARRTSISDIDHAIRVLAASKIAPHTPDSRAAARSSLGNALIARAQLQPATRAGDLAEAIAEHTAAAELGKSSPQLATFLADLGTAYLTAYEHDANLDTLEHALARFRQAVEQTATGHCEKPNRICQLGIGMLTRYEHTKADADLDAAISICRSSVALTPEDHAYYARCLYSLATALYRRGELLDMRYDFDESALLAARANRATPDDHANKANRLAFYASASQQLAGPTGLENAERDLREAMRLLPPRHAFYPILESNLGGLLRARYERAASHGCTSPETVALLRAAVQHTRAAVDATPSEHSAYLGRLVNYTAACANLADSDKEARLIDDALARCAAARNTSTAGDEDARFTTVFAYALSCRHRLTADAQSLEDALEHYQVALKCKSASSIERLAAAFDGAQLAASAGLTETAVDMFTAAVRFIDEAVWRGMPRSDQERALAKYGSLPSDAAAAAIEAGQLDLAVDLLELCRGILFDRVIDERLDLASTRAVAPDLADDFDGLRQQLELAVVPDLDTDDAPPHKPPHEPSPVDLRIRIVRKLEDVLAQIRALPGHEQLFRPPRLAEIQSSIGDEPVVVINASTYRCDALRITSRSVSLTTLPTLNHADVADRARFFRKAAADASQANPASQAVSRRLTAACAWIWDSITEPVLADLGFTATIGPDETPPLLYWCPTGQATFLPLHAAGHHADPGRRNGRSVIDRAASSYLPKLRALIPPPPPPSIAGAEDTLLIVSMPNTPGPQWPPLRSPVIEAGELMERFPNTLHLTEAAATVDAVAAALPDHRSFHFTGHGTANHRNPFAGGLVLEGDVLTIGRICELRLDEAEFAFLSACETHQAPGELAQEGITFAAALRVAGYEQVIATQWSVLDLATAELVRHTYDRVTRPDADGRARLRPELSSAALRSASCAIRDASPDQLERWAAFIHVGCRRNNGRLP